MGVIHKIRKDGQENFKTVTLQPLKAIRAFCLECVCWQPSEVTKCTDLHCPLYPYRFGKNPSRKGIGNINIGHSGPIKQPENQQTALH